MKNLYLIITIFSLALFNNYNAQAPQMEICVASVDTTFASNVIVWERTSQVSAVPIDSVLIYRSITGANNFSVIATVAYDSLSQYHDTSADVNNHSYTYAIAGKDVNGVVGDTSVNHSTIHFQLIDDNGSLQLSWTPYSGRSFSQYQCWNYDVVGQPNKTLINTTVNTSWFYNAALAGTLYEMVIDVSGMTDCNSSKANHNTTRSNKTTGTILAPQSVEEQDLSKIKLHPNPANDKIYINFADSKFPAREFTVYNLMGEVMLEGSFRHDISGMKSLEVANLPNGVYLIEVKSTLANTTTLKFAKQ